MTIPIRGSHPPIDDELLSAYLDGQVSPAERDAVAAVLAVDPAVRARLNDLRATVTLLRSLPQPVPRRTFILTPQQAAAIRPVRVPWLTRIFPTVAAVSAIAAVLCLMLIAGDLATGGFGARTQQIQQAPLARSAVESASSAATETASPAAAATTAAAAPVVSAPLPAATTPPAPAAAATITGRTAALFPPATAANGSAPSNLAPSAAGASAATEPPAPTAAPTAVPTASSPPAPSPTVVANAQPAAPVATTPTLSPGGATVVTTETHRVPVALIRAGEIVLALLAAAGITLAILSRRSRAAQR